LLEILGDSSIYFPRLRVDVPFEKLAALLNNDKLREQLYQRRIGRVDIKSATKANNLNQWFQNIFDDGWQLLYDLIYEARSINVGLRQPHPNDEDIIIDDADVTHVSDVEFYDVCDKLQHQIDTWLDADEFRNIERQLRMRLTPDDEIRFIIQTEDNQIRKLPWHTWRFFKDYPQAEVGLSAIEFEPRIPAKSSVKQVRILAIFGESTGIDIDTERRLLSSLPGAKTVFLVESKRYDLDEQLWDKQGWDILFFAGHSSSKADGETGQIYINNNDNLTITQLKNALKKAIECGLQIAIFNSCDGLGLAQQLDDLHIPQIIVMR
jgi:hypothetical protein